VLDGKSLLPVFSGKQEHKQFVFGEMTTRGIINGSDHFGIRSVRSERFKYIWNFSPDVEFQNACTASKLFRSWVAKAESGDEDAARLVHRYTHRPEIELYDIVDDPNEMNNLAENPEYAAVMATLRAELDQWMRYCSDRGQATEMDASDHMGGKRKARSASQKKKQNARG
ncbi:MAG: sulfatase/phosphatase domain-containing protein, partial [Rhodopirellula sp. JB053]